MSQIREIKETWSPKLNELIEMLKDGGPSQEEFFLMGIIAIMDETLRDLAYRDERIADAIFGTYYEVELYIENDGVGH